MKKILIVEDDPIMARMYQKTLTFEGYEVKMAHNGEEGYEMALLFKPALILLDVMMPKMNGLLLLEKLKKKTDTAHIKVIMLTNLDMPKEVEYALSLGASEYVIKGNHEPREVVELIKKLIS